MRTMSIEAQKAANGGGTATSLPCLIISRSGKQRIA